MKPSIIKIKLSDFLINISASYFVAMFISPGFESKNTIDLLLTFIYYLLLAIMSFITSIIILKT